MTYRQYLKKIDEAFEESDWQGFQNLVEHYYYEFLENDIAIEALDNYLSYPGVQNQLPGYLQL